MYFRQEDVEDIRERMRVETGLVVVGSADDQLRVGKTKKLMEGVTQSMIDRCILVSKRDTRKPFLCNMQTSSCPLLLSLYSALDCSFSLSLNTFEHLWYCLTFCCC